MAVEWLWLLVIAPHGVAAVGFGAAYRSLHRARYPHARPAAGHAGARAGSQAPDYLEPVLGWRGWLVVKTRHGLRLRSAVQPFLWPPRHAFVAECHRPGPFARHSRSTHPVPEPRCGCGVYATRDPEPALSYAVASARRVGALAAVVGQVSLWGRVAEAEAGWQASHAYPRRLFLVWGPAGRDGDPARLTDELQETYGIPVERVVPPAPECELAGRLRRLV
jgi:hypothetical protein